MTDTQPTPRLSAAIDGYVVAVFREVIRLAAGLRRGFDPGDIADEIVAHVLERPEVIMVRYPNPVLYARARVRHAGISHDRHQRVQRGEGARLFRDADGLLRPGRPYGSGNVTPAEGGAELFSTAHDARDQFEASADDRMYAVAELRRCCQGLSIGQVHELWLVDGCGFTVQEVADMCGQRRETVSRRLNETRRRIRQNRAGAQSEKEATA